ncbi:MAG: aminotransferase class I/II-fold pyridoxal phosphate-dependent enzyme [SAR324 cluster bacterium]|jgi:aspartate aminotransferase|nr:aminotransferase class I/II-fold pyridoxal phosphate-dependent enzyme [SAR324 cluster bacterium]|tara:strand:+ start:88 stop:1392 length:1305 start_codon:yes stop_codon:yes gene_type:complete
MTLFAERNQRIDTENAFKVGPHIVKVERASGAVVKLNLGEPDFALPAHIKSEIKRQLDLDNTHYCDPKGVPGLREAISRQVNETRGLQTTPEQVVVFPGGKPSIGLTQQVYCDPGDEVIYPSPGFPIYESFIRYVRAVPVPLHLDEVTGFTFTPEQLEALITPKTKVIYLNFPSNPTGGVATREQLEGIAKVILEKGRPDLRVYSDEIYENILFDGQQHASITAVPGMTERTIIASGFSKTYAWTGGRIGYAVFPTVEEAEVFTRLNINYFSCTAPYNQEAAKLALESPLSAPVIAKMVATFEQRRNVIWQQLNDIPGVSCQKPGGAFYLFPNISGVCEQLGLVEYHAQLPEAERQATSPSGLFQLFALYGHRVAVLDRKSFGQVGADGLHFLRLSTASDLPVLADGVRCIRNASEDHAGLRRFLETRPDLQTD